VDTDFEGLHSGGRRKLKIFTGDDVVVVSAAVVVMVMPHDTKYNSKY
jgi:hypothetical protein